MGRAVWGIFVFLSFLCVSRDELQISNGVYAAAISSFVFAAEAERNFDALDVQKALARAGYYKGELDGISGPMTREATRAFQEANGLKIDGVCGPLTWEKLRLFLEAGAETQKAKPVISPVEELNQKDPAFMPERLRERKRALSEHELKQKLVP